MKKFILLCSIMFAHLATAQVGIGNDTPDQKSMLDIVSPNNDKGILIPRITEAQRDAISVENAQNGLMVYNTTEDCFNYWNRLESVWSSICGKAGKAVFEITDCSTIKVFGQYLNKTALGSSNYIKLTVNVTKIGSYSITGMPNPDNGYYFLDSGEFLATGQYEIILKGAGTPTNVNETPGDLIKFALNGVDSSCNTTYVKVEDSSIKPLFTMGCNSVKVNGVYILNKSLNASSNTITLTLNVDPSAYGSTYIISTNEVDGISFSGSGLLSQANQEVTLVGTGTPTSLTPKVLTITSNSISSVATCTATVNIAYTAKKILGIGYYNNAYGYHLQSGSAPYNMLMAQQNFGTSENSLVKIEGLSFNYIDGETQRMISGTGIINQTALTNALSQNPDIIVVGYFLNYDSATIQQLTDYVYKGGVLILFSENTYANATIVSAFFKNLFGDNSISGSGVNGGGVAYQLSGVNDDIMVGPFGDLRGKRWGEDASATLSLSGIPSGNIVTYSGANTATGTTTYSGVTMFKHSSLNIFWCGDGGFLSNYNSYVGPSYGSTSAAPFAVDASYNPITRTNWAGGDVENSRLFGNLMSWAIKQAQFNGINTNN
ncbi:hypothetical protein O2K51_12880 [Apibacter raozihei]|uniref:hypothetical protein n=1 Tax=Apibacter raozihei TaxID=2500547 RepID=UPI000FE324F8|nr:hypothetical protein [Apibacter raozihei]